MQIATESYIKYTLQFKNKLRQLITIYLSRKILAGRNPAKARQFTSRICSSHVVESS
jgi:hypothetical protein